jgi:hypothetical protein
VQVFEELFLDYVINVIVEETQRYAKEYKNYISVKEFRRQIARTYLKKGLESRTRGRPTKLIPPRTSNVPDIRYDQILHTIQKRDK